MKKIVALAVLFFLPTLTDNTTKVLFGGQQMVDYEQRLNDAATLARIAQTEAELRRNPAQDAMIAKIVELFPALFVGCIIIAIICFTFVYYAEKARKK